MYNKICKKNVIRKKKEKYILMINTIKINYYQNNKNHK